jgi:hypothetical protein
MSVNPRNASAAAGGPSSGNDEQVYGRLVEPEKATTEQKEAANRRRLNFARGDDRNRPLWAPPQRQRGHSAKP